MKLLNLKFQNYLNFFKQEKKKISIIKNLVKPPYGGGNQFILALLKELRKTHLVYHNIFSKKISTYLFDSIWLTDFQIMKLHEMKKKGAKIIHRVDGPLQIYRMEDGQDDIKNDDKLIKLNSNLASTTIIQSKFALKQFEKLNYNFVNTNIINNASDNDIFFPSKKNLNKKIKLISTSWSKNRRKGQSFFEWMDKNLNFEKYDFEFIGRMDSKFKNIVKFDAMNSEKLATKLRSADIFVFASLNETCSNSLIEALSCGLPVLYIDSGSNGELVKNAGLSFKNVHEIPLKLQQIIDRYDYFKNSIEVQEIKTIAKKYSLFF